MGTSSRSVAFLTRIYAGVVVALAAMITSLPSVECRGAYTTGASFSSDITNLAIVYQNGLPSLVESRGAYPHAEGISGGVARLSYISETYQLDYFNEPAIDLSVRTVGGELSTWSPTSGQIDALTTGAHVRAVTRLDYAQSAAIYARTVARANINLVFDEPVRLSVWYAADSGGFVQVNAGGGGQIFASGPTEFVVGSAVYVTTFATLSATVGADVQVSIDSNAGNEIPSSDEKKHPGAGASVAWSISSLDEPPPPPPPGPGTTGRLPVGLPLDPNGGFDPLPIGSRNMAVSPSGLTSVGVPTQVPFGEFQGALVESYAFSTGDIPITSLVIPSLPAGADLSLAFGQETRSVAAGEVVDFGPAGIEEFTLSGFDPASASQSPEALLLSLQFAGPGVTNVEARAVEFIAAADFDLDGAVDQGDLASWTSHFGEAAATHSQGDANGDGIVDGDDFLYWQRQATPAAVTDAVPEPSAVAMLGVVVCGLMYCRQGGSDG